MPGILGLPGKIPDVCSDLPTTFDSGYFLYLAFTVASNTHPFLYVLNKYLCVSSIQDIGLDTRDQK